MRSVLWEGEGVCCYITIEYNTVINTARQLENWNFVQISAHQRHLLQKVMGLQTRNVFMIITQWLMFDLFLGTRFMPPVAITPIKSREIFKDRVDHFKRLHLVTET